MAGFGIPQRPRFASDGSATGTSDAMLRSTKLGMSLDDLLFTSADLNNTEDVLSAIRGGEDDVLSADGGIAGRSKSRLGDKKKAVGKSTVNLSLHGAIGAGWLTSVDVGGGGWNSLGLVDSMDEPGEVSAGTFLCGTVIRQLSVAHSLSGDHECMLSLEAKQLVGDGSTGSTVVRTEERTQEEESGDGEGEMITRVAYKLISVHTDAVLDFKHVLSTEHSYRIDALLEGLSFEQRLLAKDALEKYVPDSLLERLQAGQAGWLGELRPVSIAFVNFDVKVLMTDPSPDAKATKGPLLHALKELERAIIIAFQLTLSAGAFIRQFTMDEKGLVLIYCCGLPGGRPIDSKHQQAVSLGVSLHRRLLEELNHKVGIGIASGRVCCGFVGQQDLRCEYSLVGDTVNLAARLAGRAQKTGEGVVCCAGTVEPLRAEPFRLCGLSIESGGFMRPKGKTYDVEVFVVKSSSVGATTDHRRLSSFSISVGVGAHYRKISSTSDAAGDDTLDCCQPRGGGRGGGGRYHQETRHLPSEPLLEREEPLQAAIACIKSVLDPAVARREYEKDKAVAAQVHQQQVLQHSSPPCCSVERKTADGEDSSLEIPSSFEGDFRIASALSGSSLLSAGVIRPPPSLCTPLSQQGSGGGMIAPYAGGGGGRGVFFSAENNCLSGKWLAIGGSGGSALPTQQQQQSIIPPPPTSTTASSATLGTHGEFWPPVESLLTPVAGTSKHSAAAIASPRSQRPGRPTEKLSNNSNSHTAVDSSGGGVILQQLASAGSTGPRSPTDDDFHGKQVPGTFCCIIEGEAGMGKTALLRCLCERMLIFPRKDGDNLGSAEPSAAAATSPSAITPSPADYYQHHCRTVGSLGLSNTSDAVSPNPSIGSLSSLAGVDRLEILSVCGLEMEQATPYAMLGRLIAQVIKLILDGGGSISTGDVKNDASPSNPDDSIIDATALTRVLPRRLWTSILQLVNMCIPLCNTDYLLELQAAQEFPAYGCSTIPEPPIFHKKENGGLHKRKHLNGNINNQNQLGGGSFFQNSVPTDNSCTSSIGTMRPSFTINAHKRDVQAQQQSNGHCGTAGATNNGSPQLKEISELCCALLQAALRSSSPGGSADSSDSGMMKTRPIAIVLDDIHFVDGWSLDVLLQLIKAAYEDIQEDNGGDTEWQQVEQHQTLYGPQNQFDKGDTEQQQFSQHIGELKLMGRVCFIATGRPELSMPSDIRRTYRHLLALPTCFRVELHPLTGFATASLAENILGSKSLSSSPGLAESITQTCGGNPFFIRELCGAIAKTSSSANSNAAAASTSAQLVPSAILEGNFFQQEISLPASVQNLTVAKVDALGAKLSLVLKVAAVLGERFTGDLLANVFTESLGLERCSLEACLVEICDGPGRILQRKPGTENYPPLSNEAEYRFSSILVLHTTYSMQLHSYRRRLHCRTAMEIQRRRAATMGGGEDEDACLLAAAHWLRVLRLNELDDDDVKHCVEILQIPDDGHTHARLWTMGMEAITQGIVRLRRKGLLDASGTLAKQALYMMGVMETSVCPPLEDSSSAPLDDTSIFSPLSSPMGATSNVGILQAGSGLCPQKSEWCKINYDGRGSGGAGAATQSRGEVAAAIFSHQQSMLPTTALNQRKVARAGTGTGWQQRDVAEFYLLMECSTTMRFLEDGTELTITVLAQRASCLLLMSQCSGLPLRDRLRCTMFVAECHLEAGRTGAALASLESMYEHVSASGPPPDCHGRRSATNSNVFSLESFPSSKTRSENNNRSSSVVATAPNENEFTPPHPPSNYVIQESVLLRLEILAPMALEALMRGNLEEADNLSGIASVWIEQGSPAPYCLSVLDPVVLLVGVRMFIGASNLDAEEYINYCRALVAYLTGGSEGNGRSDGSQLPQPLQAHCSLICLCMLWMGTFHLTELFWLVRFMDTILYKARHPRLTAVETVARQVCSLMKLEQEVQAEMSEKVNHHHHYGHSPTTTTADCGDGEFEGPRKEQRRKDLTRETSGGDEIDPRIIEASQELMDNMMQLPPGDRVMCFPAVAFAFINAGYTDLSYQAHRVWRSDMGNGAAGGYSNGALLSWLAMADGGNLLRQAYTTARTSASSTSATTTALNNKSNYSSSGGYDPTPSANLPSVMAMHQREQGLERIRMGLDIARQQNVALAESWAQSELDLWEAYPLPIPLPTMPEVDDEESEEEFGSSVVVIKTTAGIEDGDDITAAGDAEEEVGGGVMKLLLADNEQLLPPQQSSSFYEGNEESNNSEGEIMCCAASPSSSTGVVKPSTTSMYHLLYEEQHSFSSKQTNIHTNYTTLDEQQQPDVRLPRNNPPLSAVHQQYGLSAALASIKGAKQAIISNCSISPLDAESIITATTGTRKKQNQRNSRPELDGNDILIGNSLQATTAFGQSPPSLTVSGSDYSHVRTQQQRRFSNRQVSFKDINGSVGVVGMTTPLKSITVHNATNTCDDLIRRQVNSKSGNCSKRREENLVPSTCEQECNI